MKYLITGMFILILSMNFNVVHANSKQNWDVDKVLKIWATKNPKLDPEKNSKPEILDTLISEILKAVEPHDKIIPPSKEEHVQAKKQAKGHRLAYTYMNAVAGIINDNPELLPKIKPLLESESQYLQLHVIDLLGLFEEKSEKYIPVIKQMMESEKLNPYSKELFNLKGTDTLRKIKKPIWAK